MEYIDFQLVIDRGSEGVYTATVVSTQGVDSVSPVAWALPDALEHFQGIRGTLMREFEERAVRSRDSCPERGAQSAFATESKAMSPREFGEKLARAVFTAEILLAYQKARWGAAQRGGTGVRLRLHVKPAELAVLPWEFLMDITSQRPDFFCLSNDTPLVRISQDHPAPSGPCGHPLRVLAMIGPSESSPLDLEWEQEALQREIGLLPHGLIELRWVPTTRASDLHRELHDARRASPPHIFHFAGHGEGRSERSDGWILVNADSAGEKLLSPVDLARLLKGSGLRLVVLNCCKSAKNELADAFSSMAATLAASGIPAVIAMQYAISDTAANRFAAKLYELLASGASIELAVTEARLALRLDDVERHEWGTPVLYLNARDGLLFDPVPTPMWRSHPVLAMGLASLITGFALGCVYLLIHHSKVQAPSGPQGVDASENFSDPSPVSPDVLTALRESALASDADVRPGAVVHPSAVIAFDAEALSTVDRAPGLVADRMIGVWYEGGERGRTLVLRGASTTESRLRYTLQMRLGRRDAGIGTWAVSSSFEGIETWPDQGMESCQYRVSLNPTRRTLRLDGAGPVDARDCGVAALEGSYRSVPPPAQLPCADPNGAPIVPVPSGCPTRRDGGV